MGDVFSRANSPVGRNIEVVDVPLLVSAYKPVALATISDANELHMLSLRSQPDLCVAY